MGAQATVTTLGVERNEQRAAVEDRQTSRRFRYLHDLAEITGHGPSVTRGGDRCRSYSER